MRIFGILIVGSLAALGYACSSPGPATDTSADVAAVNEVREREMGFVNSGDVDQLVAGYAEDIVMMPPNEPAVIGREAVRSWAEAMFGQVTINGRYTSSEVIVSGDWAIDRYVGVLTTMPKAGGDTGEERIKGVHIMRRQPDGTWLIAQDVWNADAPASSSPPATP
jgi:ketosteroid isomerase-like protein